jgi:hypothetical protein
LPEALNSEDKQNKNNPETEATLGIKHSTAKTNETKTIQRHRRHWAYNTQQRRPTKQKQSRDRGDIGPKLRCSRKISNSYFINDFHHVTLVENPVNEKML